VTGLGELTGQVSILIDRVTYTLTYDAENRLIGIAGGSLTASYVYDDDGARVRAVVNGVATNYVGNYYEATTGSFTKYYYAGGQRVACEATPFGAQRVNGTLYFGFSDHLSSTSITVDVNGTIVGNELYKAWGGERYTNGSIQTTFKYTGQRHAAGAHSGAEAGLYFYNARWYDPAVGRFIQADTIIPEPGNPLAWDRYAYANNNPVKYTDPTGHLPCENSILGCKKTNTLKRENRNLSAEQLGIEFVGDWTQKERNYVLQAATLVANNISSILGMSASYAFRTVYGVDSEHPFIFVQDSCEMCEGGGAFTAGSRLVDIDYENGFAKVIGSRTTSMVDSYNVNTMVHELGHAFNQRNSGQQALNVETYMYS